jgi:CRISPR-associated protein Cas2
VENARAAAVPRSSVFRCELSRTERLTLKEKLWPILKLDEDRVMIVDLGPVDGRGEECIEFWGLPRTVPRRCTSLIV